MSLYEVIMANRTTTVISVDREVEGENKYYDGIALNQPSRTPTHCSVSATRGGFRLEVRFFDGKDLSNDPFSLAPAEVVEPRP